MLYVPQMGPYCLHLPRPVPSMRSMLGPPSHCPPSTTRVFLQRLSLLTRRHCLCQLQTTAPCLKRDVPFLQKPLESGRAAKAPMHASRMTPPNFHSKGLAP